MSIGFCVYALTLLLLHTYISISCNSFSCICHHSKCLEGKHTQFSSTYTRLQTKSMHSYNYHYMYAYVLLSISVFGVLSMRFRQEFKQSARARALCGLIMSRNEQTLDCFQCACVLRTCPPQSDAAAVC